MAVNLSPVGGVAAQFFTNSGAPLTGGKIFTYAAGTTTPQASYTTSQGNVAWTNPIVLDAAGRVPSGGEIWLTDGLIYKFILKDANDVLIATYDNITGINSNAVAYTNSQEIQTATAGQTVFTLTTMQYQVGTNSLSVFVDGVNQYGPGAQYSYVETDSTTVTFNAGLHVGAEVKFTTTQQQGAGAVDASQVSYDPPFTGSVVTNVEAKLAQTVSVKDFGAVGDGVTDDSAAIQAAIDSGEKLYFPAGVYLCNVEINSFFTWEGDGMKVSVLKPFTTTLPCVTNLYEEPDWRFTSITDIGFESAGQNGIGFCFGDPASYTTGMENIGRVTFNRCGWQYFDKGVYKPYGNIGNVFNDCSFQWNNYGYFAQSNNLLNPAAPIMHAGADTFNQGEAHENLIAAFCILDDQAGNGGSSWNNIIIEYNPGFGIFIDSGSLTNPFNPYQFNCPWLEGNASDPAVTIQTISGPQSLAPKQIEVLTSADNYGYSLWGQSGGNVNGINTINPQAPLGIWRNEGFGLNLIGGGYGTSWTGIRFSELGDENVNGASIQSFKQTGTDRNMVFNAGSFAGASYETNGSVKIGNAAVAASTPGDGSHLLYGNDNTAAAKILTIGAAGVVGVRFYVDDSDNSNAANTVIRVGRNLGTGRSINAGGTVNASGADYAEYMTKAGDFTINKGDVCGIDANGKLTNVFSQAITFVVKSTNPSYVGGDTWGAGAETADEIESRRTAVDRIAFAGQTPVNVIGAIAGQYIVPVQLDGDAIGGVAVSNPTFEQYQIAIGKVIAIENDGRARVIVKIA